MRQNETSQIYKENGMSKTATKPAKKSKMNTVTKPEKKISGKNTFQALADHVGARIADLADEVIGANPDATLGDLQDELDMLVGSLSDFIEYGGWDREKETDVEISGDTPLETLR
jgi:hypothetical protein